ncbi:MAG: Na(+)/H(+) antiporter subunit D [Opitutales bacterium]|nr:Na(+)/H(+) antiporter subunit D [Opitutales bacterium]
MSNIIPPQFILLIGALVVPFLRGRIQQIIMLLVPLLTFGAYLQMEEGVYWVVKLLDFELTFGRADKLSLIFVNIFTLVSFIAALYNIKTGSNLEHFAGLLYAGCAVGMVLAGDLITLFIFWEMLTVGAVLLILARKSSTSMGAALRYVLVHIVGGLILLSGIVLHIAEFGSIEFNQIGLSNRSSYLIFIGFGLNCAWPLLHAWLPDAYPEATVGGVIYMAAFTTKGAIYALMRGFPGEPSLVWIGVAMAIFSLFYALLANDLRRVLAYSIINQVGFMVIGIGMGTALALNGAAAHVYCHVLYKSLLFMSIGAVILQTGGKSKITELGGLFKSMPITGVFCLIGALAISTPLFSGFVSKSMLVSAAGKAHLTIVWLVLLYASAGVFLCAGLKVPFFTFFSKDRGIRVKEAPVNMLVAMGITALLCIAVGMFPHQTIYKMLPFSMKYAYEPYTFSHINAQILLLTFSILAFVLMLLSGFYPATKKAILLDIDWVYRSLSKQFYKVMDKGLNGLNVVTGNLFINGITHGVCRFASNGAAKSSLLVMKPVWKMSGLSNEDVTIQEAQLLKTFEKGTTAIGIGSVLVLITLSILTITAIV